LLLVVHSLKLSDELQSELKRMDVKTILALSRLAPSDVDPAFHAEIKTCLNSFDKVHQFNDESDHSVSEVGEISEGPSEPISLNLGKLVKSAPKQKDPSGGLSATNKAAKTVAVKKRALSVSSVSSSYSSPSPKKAKKKAKKTDHSDDSDETSSNSEDDDSVSSFSTGSNKFKTKFKKFMNQQGRELHLLFSTAYVVERGEKASCLQNFRDFGEATAGLLKCIKDKSSVQDSHIVNFSEKMLRTFTTIATGKGGLKCLSLYYSKIVTKALKKKTDLDVIKTICSYDKKILKKSQKNLEKGKSQWENKSSFKSRNNKSSYNYNYENKWWKNDRYQGAK
jgi:hypothetical protein